MISNLENDLMKISTFFLDKIQLCMDVHILIHFKSQQTENKDVDNDVWKFGAQ